MKILHIIYSSGVYGAEKHLLDLLPGLKENDINCELLFICPRKIDASLHDYIDEMNKKGIKSTLLPTSNKVSVFLSAKKIYHYLKKNKIQVIHSHLFSADIIAVLIKKIYFKELIILSTKHGYEEKYLLSYGMGSRKIPNNLYYFISKEIFKRIDYNIAVSGFLADLYKFIKIGNNKMEYISHGVSPVSSSKTLELHGYPRIITVGRLSEIKGHKYLFKAMPEIIKQFPEIKLYILGVGPLEKQLRKLSNDLFISKNIEFVGFANPSEYIKQCEVMIFPSLFETFGLTFIESFALNIPVISFEIEAAKQLIKNNESGIMVPKGDYNALAEKTIFLLQSPDARKKITEKAYQYYLQLHTAEKMAKETAKWYRTVLN